MQKKGCIMEALYKIFPIRPVLDMSGWGFCVALYPALKDEVKLSGLTQFNADSWVQCHHDKFLEACGFDWVQGGTGGAIRMTWGEWGPEHISVPGNACGLDIDNHAMCAPRGGAALLPHNVDSMGQAMLLVCVVTGIMETFALQQEIREYKQSGL